jgi:hypothetical protein
MGTPPPYSAQGLTNFSFAHALGANVAGRANYSVPWPGQPQRGRVQAPAIIPYAFPVMVGGYGYQQPNVTYVVQQAPPPQMAPNVVINQSFGGSGSAAPAAAAESGLREFQASGPPPTPEPERKAVTADEEKPTIYLIAFNDGTVYSALAFWVEGATLHYITTQHSHNRASVELVDRKVSEQLNRERGVEFRLAGK